MPKSSHLGEDEPPHAESFTGLSQRSFGKLVTVLRREGADTVGRGRPWSLPLEDRTLLVAAYWRTNLTMRQLALLFGVSKSAADRIIDHLGPMIALRPRRSFDKGTVLIVDGTLVPTRDHTIADGGYPGTGLVMPHRRRKAEELPDGKEAHNKSHKQVRARVEHVFARMKNWKILRDCRLKGDGVHHAMLGIARLHNLNLSG
ncbi:transposase family protein [Streptomyces sp. NPDC003717]|uniref:transposase family protein n=1 Tax=Streptomyces sp. NPDC003717 TaxID=3154276 RepID=UPI0033BC1598